MLNFVFTEILFLLCGKLQNFFFLHLETYIFMKMCQKSIKLVANIKNVVKKMFKSVNDVIHSSGICGRRHILTNLYHNKPLISNNSNLCIYIKYWFFTVIPLIFTIKLNVKFYLTLRGSSLGLERSSTKII